jgi:hypothetical protein
MCELRSSRFSKIASVSKYYLFGEQIAFVFQFLTKFFYAAAIPNLSFSFNVKFSVPRCRLGTASVL